MDRSAHLGSTFLPRIRPRTWDHEPTDEAEEGAEDEAEEEDDQEVEEEDDNGDRDDDEKDPEDKDEADTRLSGE